MPENIDALLESLDSQMDEILKIEDQKTENTGVVSDFDALFAEATEQKSAADVLAESEDFDIDAEAAKILAEDGLTEATVMKLDKKAQLKKKISMAAIGIAKEEAPQVYAKYKAAQAKKVQLEELMIKKFKSKALAKVKAEVEA